MEEWKPFPLNKEYEVSTEGRVRSTHKVITKKDGTTYTRVPKVLKPATDGSGYYRVAFNTDGHLTTYKVHRMVAQTFIENPNNKPDVNHINGVKTDNKLSNLEWVTRSENMKHAVKTGLVKPPSNRGVTINPDGKSCGVKGVYWDRFRNKWAVEIKLDNGTKRGKKKYLGRYDDVKEAISVIERANIEYRDQLRYKDS